MNRLRWVGPTGIHGFEQKVGLAKPNLAHRMALAG